MKNNMISENFVVETRKLFHEGLIQNPNDEIAEEVLRETLMIERNSSEYVFDEDPILDLIKNYNLETFDIGRIHFYSDEELEFNENYIIIGFDGAGEFIAIEKHSKKIYSIDGNFEVISFCSNSSEEFLNNLIKIGEAHIKRWTREKRLELAKSMGDNTNMGFYADALDAY